MTQSYFEMRDVTKKFKDVDALDSVTLSVTEPSIVGLVGKNGSGKTTLLRHIVGLQLPTSGTCTTLGVSTSQLDAAQLSRMGMSHQHDQLLPGMRVDQMLRYVSGFYDRWDTALEKHLVSLFEIDTKARIITTTPGNRQKLSLVIAVCHHPSLLLLDEPLSDLDPIVRRDVVETILDQFRNDAVAIVISSHLLQDIERIADRIVCLDEGHVIADSSLDDLKEKYGTDLDDMFRMMVGASK
jgi:ABC-2 type transport system ATP-binding protein